jgi:hypothetical protein
MVRVNGTADVIQCLRDYQAWHAAQAVGARESAQAPSSAL